MEELSAKAVGVFRSWITGTVISSFSSARDDGMTGWGEGEGDRRGGRDSLDWFSPVMYLKSRKNIRLS